MVEVDLGGMAWVLIGVFAILAGVIVFKNQVLKMQIKNLDVDDVVKRLKLKEQYVKDLEDEIDGYRNEIDETKKEVATWTGKYHQKGQIKKLSGDKYDLTKKSDIGIVAEDVLNQIEDSLPLDIQKVIKDPGIRSKILDYANQHPEEATNIIKSFISAPSTKKQSENIPGFDSKAAI